MKVLIVDDSKGMRMIIRRTLRQAGYEQIEVVEASNGVEALELSKTIAPELILCDWNMPEMSGIELLAQLKLDGCPSRFGFVTSEATPEIRARALEGGALFLLTKPFTADSFQEALGPLFDYVGKR